MSESKAPPSNNSSANSNASPGFNRESQEESRHAGRFRKKSSILFRFGPKKHGKHEERQTKGSQDLLLYMFHIYFILALPGYSWIEGTESFAIGSKSQEGSSRDGTGKILQETSELVGTRSAKKKSISSSSAITSGSRDGSFIGSTSINPVVVDESSVSVPPSVATSATTTDQISSQFKMFFSKRSGSGSASGSPSIVLASSQGPSPASDARAIGTATTAGTWTAPDSWAVQSDSQDASELSNLNNIYQKKSISAKLLDDSREAMEDTTNMTKSNTTLISSLAITSTQGEGIQPEMHRSNSTSSTPGISIPEPSTSVAGGEAIPAEWEASALWSIRVFKPAKEEAHLPAQTRLSLQSNNSNGSSETFVTLACPLETTAEELSQALAKKFFLQDSSNTTNKYQLFVVHRNAERMLSKSDKPLLLQKKWLQEVGFTSLDHLNKLGRDDNRFVCKFVYAEVPSNLNIHEALQLSSRVRIEPTEAILPGQNLYLIPVVLFRYAITLQTLDLSKNLMLNLPVDFIQSCTALTTLRLCDAEMDHIPAAVVEAPTLTSLDLSVNFLGSSACSMLGKLKNLTHLNLQANQLVDLPEEFQDLIHLTSLNLASNYFTKVPQVLTKLRKLSILNISFNFLRELTDISGLGSLTELNVACNVLTALPPKLCVLLPYLRALDVRGNAIVDLEPVHQCPLQRLLLDYNSVSVLPPLLLSSLMDLSASHNPFTRLSDVCQLMQLRVLSLAQCKMIGLPENLFLACPNLEKLILDDNKLKALPGSFSTLKESLSTFSAVNNKLIEIPTSIGSFKKLMYMDLRGNNLKSIPVEIWELESLEVLNLSSNLITGFPMPLDGMLERIRGVANTLTTQVKNGRSSEIESWILPENTTPVDRRSSIVALTPYHRLLKNGKSVAASDKIPEVGEEAVRVESSLGLSASLREFYIGENRLKDEAMDAIQYLVHLQILNVSYNGLYEIGSLKLLARLRELYLSGNHLTTLPEDIDQLPLLKILFVNGNKLVHLPAELSRNHMLIALDASDNQLKYNIANFQYDWNWNSNLSLRYLNLAGNRKLEISGGGNPYSGGSSGGVAESGTNEFNIHELATFHKLSKLRLLDLSGVKVHLESALPLEPNTDGISSNTTMSDKRVRYIKVDPDYWMLLQRSGGQHPSSSQRHPFHRIIPVESPSSYGVVECPSRLSGDLFAWDFIEFKFMSKDEDLLCGMFDGHQSSAIAKYLHAYFAFIYSTELAKMEREICLSSTGIGVTTGNSVTGGKIAPTNTPSAAMMTLSDVMRRSFIHLNRELGRLVDEGGVIKDTRGATGIVAHVYGRRMIVGNVGDSLAVLCRGGHALLVSTKHSPWNRSERSRIRRRGGYVDTNGLLEGQVSVSRAFGYFEWVPSITSEPSCHIIELNESDEFLIMASNGLWNWIDPETAVDIVRSEAEDLGLAARKLRDVALSYGTVDAISIVILSLSANKGSNTEEEELLGATSGFWRKSTNRRRLMTDEITDSALARLGAEICPPLGALVLVFTDIRNSTLLWEMMPQAMEAAIKVHNLIMRRLLRTIGGYEVKTEGDAFMVAFSTIEKALKWCLHAQTQLLDADWPSEILESSEGTLLYGTLNPEESDHYLLYRGLSVRMGLHFGTPISDLDPITHRMDYFGNMVNKAARISGMAKGGQITCSQEMYTSFKSLKDVNSQLLQSSLLEPVFFDLGEHKLKGLEHPERIHACYPKLLSGRFFLQKIQTEGILQPTLLTQKDPDEKEEHSELSTVTVKEMQEGITADSMLPISAAALKPRASYYGAKQNFVFPSSSNNNNTNTTTTNTNNNNSNNNYLEVIHEEDEEISSMKAVKNRLVEQVPPSVPHIAALPHIYPNVPADSTHLAAKLLVIQEKLEKIAQQLENFKH